MSAFVLLSTQKPPMGDPCNGCGACCQNEACSLSVDLLHSSVAPCIALEFDGSRYRCGLVVRPHHYLDLPNFTDGYLRSLVSEMLGVGKGCCSEMTTPAAPPAEVQE